MPLKHVKKHRFIDKYRHFMRLAEGIAICYDEKNIYNYF